jgi:hypothetical protein
LHLSFVSHFMAPEGLSRFDTPQIMCGPLHASRCWGTIMQCAERHSEWNAPDLKQVYVLACSHPLVTWLHFNTTRVMYVTLRYVTRMQSSFSIRRIYLSTCLTCRERNSGILLCSFCSDLQRLGIKTVVIRIVLGAIVIAGKVKVMLSLCLTKHHAMKKYWGVEEQLHELFDLDGDEWSDSRLGRFTPVERAPGTRWIGGWVDPRAGLDLVSKRKIPSSHRKSNPDHPVVQPIANCYTDWAIPTIFHCGGGGSVSNSDVVQVEFLPKKAPPSITSNNLERLLVHRSSIPAIITPEVCDRPDQPARFHVLGSQSTHRLGAGT